MDTGTRAAKGPLALGDTVPVSCHFLADPVGVPLTRGVEQGQGCKGEAGGKPRMQQGL